MSIDPKADLLVWWLSQSDCEVIDREPQVSMAFWPKYLTAQYQSRYGRAGRGWLWVDRSIESEYGEIEIKPWPDTPLARLLGQLCGGIVIRKTDRHFVANLPGVLTDLNLEPVKPVEQSKKGD